MVQFQIINNKILKNINFPSIIINIYKNTKKNDPPHSYILRFNAIFSTFNANIHPGIVIILITKIRKILFFLSPLYHSNVLICLKQCDTPNNAPINANITLVF